MTAKHLLLWLGLLLATFLIVPVFATSQTIWGTAQSELNLLEDAFGLHDAKSIARTADSLYEQAFVETGLVGGLDRFYSDQNSRRAANEIPGASAILSAATNHYVEGVSAVFYIMSVRMLIILSWLPYILPFMLGAVGEGVARRQIKYSTMGQYGAALYAVGLQASVVLVFVPALYLIAPFPITPLIVPFWALLAALPVVVVIANASQILPR